MAFLSSPQISASISLAPYPPKNLGIPDVVSKVSKRRRILTEEIFQLMNKSELMDLSDDDNAATKTYESRILEGESSSDEKDKETHGNILNGKTILDPSLP
ncbi:hypothetical protein TNCV_2641741 [Trichonephila clavipes]|nr:hypothetical protein TNCV_2641741 [Trichonephila clavipes]